jgi:hypothetical protein
VRILFQMDFPGYLRIYGSTVRLLAERGHRVLLCYDEPDRRRGEAAAEVEHTDGIELVPPLPEATRRHEQAIAQLRVRIDYLRYLDRRFAGSPYVRRRLDKYLRGGGLRLLVRAPYGTPFAMSALRALLLVERRLVPSDPGVERAVAALAPDVVLVTPLIGRSMRNRRQTDTVKAARRLGIPVGAGVATWDHLTTKGVVKALPDRLFVWNDLQRRDAVELHRVPAGRVVVTGAQLFDDWFERAPSSSRESFLDRVGLDRSSRALVVYVGSSPNITPPEREILFVRRWLEALRSSGDPLLERVGVVVRPHPHSVEAWAPVDLNAGGAAIAPRERPATPMSAKDRELYYDTIHFSSAVVGINTTAMVESFIQRRPVLTVREPEFRETQEGTLHFGNLRAAAGAALQIASSVDEHLSQLRAALEHPDRYREGTEAFLRTFVRPRGLGRPATEVLADEIEALAARKPS